MELLRFFLILLAIPFATTLILLGIRMFRTDQANFNHMQKLAGGSYNVLSGQVEPDGHMTKLGMGVDENNKLVSQCSFSEEAIDRMLNS